jgi:hypothetical protein
MTAPQPTTAEVIDPRGPRFAAIITSVILAATVALGPTWGLPLLIVQTIAFASGALLGLRYQPYGWYFRVLIRPRLAPPAELEDARPPRFAQAVGLGFALAGLVGGVFGLAVLFYVATGFALLASLLNAVFDYCLGCEVYLLGRRLGAKSVRVEGV